MGLLRRVRPRLGSPRTDDAGWSGRTYGPAPASVLVALGLPVLLALPACSEPRAVRGTDADALPRLTLTELQRIGSVEDPDLGFARINRVDVDRDGNVYVAEGQDVEIRVYRPDGSLLRRIGREGEGPGEFRRSPVFGVVGDTVWAFETFDRRLTLFGRDGTLLSTARVEEVSVPLQGTMRGIVLPRVMRPDGRLVGDLTLFTSRDGGPSIGDRDTVPVPRVLFDADGAVADTVDSDPRPPPERPSREEVEVGSLEYLVPRPPDDDPMTVLLPDGTIHVDRIAATAEEGATFSVVRVTFTGDTVYHRVFGYRPRPFSHAVLDTLALRSAVTPGGVLRIVGGVPEPIGRADDTAAVVAALRRAMDFPLYQTPIQDDFTGSDGSLWLRREDRGMPTRDWLILDPAGDPVGVVEIPRTLRLMWSRGRELLAVETDELDVPWLVRFTIGEA